MTKISYKPFGRQAILVEWTASISDRMILEINYVKNQIVNINEDLDDVIIGYNSLTLVNHRSDIAYNKWSEILDSIIHSIPQEIQSNTRLWEIPVCYDVDFGIDLNELSEQKGMSTDEIIHIHTLPIYRMYFIGFLPGFMYLGGLDERLHTPRKSTPRLRVTKGSVGIGGKQTGIYPSESAGGWNIIGRSPVSLFDVSANPCCFVQSGDQIRFVPISRQAFDDAIFSKPTLITDA